MGLIPVAGLLHRNQTLAQLADTIRSVYGRRQPQAPKLLYQKRRLQSSLAKTRG